MRKRRYEEPRMTTVEVKTEALICTSPLSTVTVAPNSVMDSDDEFD